MTGSAIALPLLGATGAHADGAAWKADNATWNRLANCESGGAWSADPGNGYFGGLMISANMWVLYGGLDYAPRADQASRGEQIAVARKVLADRGPQAWPGCADIVGLGGKGHASWPGGSSGAGGDEGSAHGAGKGSHGHHSGGSGRAGGLHLGGSDAQASTDASSDAPGSSSSSGKESSSGKGSSSGSVGDSGSSEGDRDATPPPAPSASDSASGSASADQGSYGSGRHRGTQAHEGSGGTGSEASRGAGRHASRGADGMGRRGGEGVYTVRSGDNLWTIAESHDVSGGWRALYEANKKAVGVDPDLILPGQKLDLF